MTRLSPLAAIGAAGAMLVVTSKLRAAPTPDCAMTSSATTADQYRYSITASVRPFVAFYHGRVYELRVVHARPVASAKIGGRVYQDLDDSIARAPVGGGRGGP